MMTCEGTESGNKLPARFRILYKLTDDYIPQTGHELINMQ